MNIDIIQSLLEMLSDGKIGADDISLLFDSLISQITQTGEQMVDTSAQINKAMTTLRQTTGASEKQIESLMHTYQKLGNELSTTSLEIADIANDYFKQGKTITETNSLIWDSIILAKTSGMDTADAAGFLTAITNGYQVAAEDALAVVDKLSAIDRSSAADISELADGLAKVSDNASLAGVSMDRLLGYFAAAAETSDLSLPDISTAYDDIFTRYNNIRQSGLSGSFNHSEDFSGVESSLYSEGISLRDTSNEFKDFEQILDDISGKWSSFSDVSKESVALSLAGPEHLTDFLSLMENYQTALDYTETSINSTGQAMKNFSNYTESTQAHIERFENAIISLSNTATDSGLTNFFIDLGTFGVNAVDGLVNALTPIGAATAAAFGFLNKGKSKLRFCPLWG